MPFNVTTKTNNNSGGARRNSHAKANRIRAYLEAHPYATVQDLIKATRCSARVASHVRSMWRATRARTVAP